LACVPPALASGGVCAKAGAAATSINASIAANNINFLNFFFLSSEPRFKLGSDWTWRSGLSAPRLKALFLLGIPFYRPRFWG
jgi:hypothetical protein